ncbi:MAG TPA: endonuclease/exonuclease/phosphatase family protein [Burkholderiaceae bacterium]|nr:endonuclease/exonuclease/phosphatase family protein [Burkholderiaceae bacterium]
MPSKRPAPSMRVLTVNVHKGYTALRRRFMLHELREAVRAVGSDLVFLQEVAGPGADDPTPRPWRRRGVDVIDGAHYEYLADQIWSNHAYGRNAVIDGLDHGNALLSRFPIIGYTNHDVSMPGDEARGLLHCLMLPNGGRQLLHGVCVHLGLRESHRRRQLERLLALLAREVPPNAPLIVAGDFNDWRGRADAALQGCGLVEVFRSAHGAHARSFPARWPLLRLDRIYVRQVASAHPLPLPRRPWATLSDHAPLAAEIQL